MGRTKQAGRATRGPSEHDTWNTQLLALGKLSFLASFCPVHRQMPGAGLSRIFIPAINNDCVRFFHNDQDQVCAALIWARLSNDVSERMLFNKVPPDATEWNSGPNLWFLDILAPFQHGKVVARHIARNPPKEPFYFARLDAGGALRKIVRGDASRRKRRVETFFIDPDTNEVP